MAQSVSSLTGARTGSRPAARPVAALAAIAFGIVLVGGAGFAQPQALHEGTHDTRHAFGLPCH